MKVESKFIDSLKDSPSQKIFMYGIKHKPVHDVQLLVETVFDIMEV